MPRPSRALLLLALLLVAALAQPAACAKKAAAKKGAAKKSAVGVVDTDEDDASDGGLAAGYGNLGWITMAQFEKIDLSKNKKPIFFLLSQPWCGACKALKSSLVQSEKVLLPIARDFVLVNAAGDGAMRAAIAAVPGMDKLGEYVPRGAFATPGGVLRPELTVPGQAADSQYPHFYPDANAVGGGLVTARARMSKAGLLVPGGGGGAAAKKGGGKEDL